MALFLEDPSSITYSLKASSTDRTERALSMPVYRRAGDPCPFSRSTVYTKSFNAEWVSGVVTRTLLAFPGRVNFQFVDDTGLWTCETSDSFGERTKFIVNMFRLQSGIVVVEWRRRLGYSKEFSVLFRAFKKFFKETTAGKDYPTSPFFARSPKVTQLPVNTPTLNEAELYRARSAMEEWIINDPYEAIPALSHLLPLITPTSEHFTSGASSTMRAAYEDLHTCIVPIHQEHCSDLAVSSLVAPTALDSVIMRLCDLVNKGSALASSRSIECPLLFNDLEDEDHLMSVHCERASAILGCFNDSVAVTDGLFFLEGGLIHSYEGSIGTTTDTDTSECSPTRAD